MGDRTNDSDSIGQLKLPDDHHTTTRNNMNNDSVVPSASSPVILRVNSNNSTTKQNDELTNNSNNNSTASNDSNNNTNNNNGSMESPKKAEVPLESMLNDPEGFYAPRTRKSSEGKRNQLNIRTGSGHKQSRSMDITAWAKILKGENTEAEEKKRASIDSKEPIPTRNSSRQLNRRDSVIVTFFSNLFTQTAQVMDEIVSPRTSNTPSTAPPRIETRPSLLPRKSPEEEAQHLREYEAMEKAFLKKEKERKARKEKLKTEREKRILDSTPKWREIIDHWGRTRVKNSLKELSWFGVPPILRGEVWKKAIGNNLHLTGELYEILVHQAQQMKDAKAKKIEMKIKGRSNTIVDIALDLPRTFPALSFFQQGGPSHHLLRNVLEAYTLYRPDVGYVQGMSYIAALLLLYMDAEDAFVALCNLLNRSLHYCFYRMDIKRMKRYYTVFDMLMKEYMPRVYTHFQQLGIHTEMYILDWLLTCFAKTLPLDMATRIFDLYIIEGDSFLFRAGLGLLRYWKNTEELLERDFEECLKQLNHHYSPTEEIEEEELFQEINLIPLTPKHYKELLEEGEQDEDSEGEEDELGDK